jgi:hypothetical protein
MLIHSMAAAGVDTGWGLAEIERIHARARRDGAGVDGDVGGAEEAIRAKEPVSVRAHVVGTHWLGWLI